MLRPLVEYLATEYTRQATLLMCRIDAMIEPEAPTGDQIRAYDQRHLMTYAELLDADASGVGWMEGANSILGLDPSADLEMTRLCWESHLTRARWIVSAGLGAAIEAFGARPETDIRCRPYARVCRCADAWPHPDCPGSASTPSTVSVTP